MQRTISIPLVRMVVLALAALVLAPGAASAGPQAGIDLRKTKYYMDDKGQVWLSVHLHNEGTRPVAVIGLAPDKAGPWTTVGQNVPPGATLRSAMKVPDNGVSVVWVDSSAGILRFELPQRR
ncbi:MAG TPA: hypothetical protein VGI81_14125 [Tepidisphaeraceae bacterium]|jgi:hypothetical protein